MGSDRGAAHPSEALIEEKKIQVDIQKEQDFRVEGDRDYLSKAVWNLLTNAIDCNVPEGRIVIFTARIKAAHPRMESIWAWDCIWQKRFWINTGLKLLLNIQ